MDKNVMVHFVGAGPGAPDLITVRGKRLIEQADMIIYAGSLVNRELLLMAKPSCEIFDSSKMTLGKVIAEMERGIKAQMEIVRLHTGDPSLYGAIREQMDALQTLRIPYEVCPGVSSFCAAASVLKQEYTLPGVSQTVIITRLEGRTKVPGGESLKSLAAHQSTLVIFLSTGLIKDVQRELLSGGLPADMPCAIVYKATWPEQRLVKGTLKQLVKMAEDNGITKTALIVVGNFLGSEYELSKLYDAEFETEFRKAKTLDS